MERHLDAVDGADALVHIQRLAVERVHGGVLEDGVDGGALAHSALTQHQDGARKVQLGGA